ncbi:IS5 family transposase [Funiculus sociatus GB1-A4]|nr:IS5 family transposase [Trichocoleus sp. FACHB-40]
MSQSYPSDLTDEQWELLSGLIPRAKVGGRPRSVDMQAVVNGILYILCAGCAWRMLPHDAPAWKTVYHYFRQWRIDGTWQRINKRLQQWVRVMEDHEPTPSAAVLDSQSVETATMVNIEVGYDGGKQVKGRKRHLLVDTLGLVVMVVVTAANVNDRDGARCLLERLYQIRQPFPRLVRMWVDGGYSGEKFIPWVINIYRWILEVVLRPQTAQGFEVLPKRWVVERAFGWFNWCRRLSKDYEILPVTSEAFIYVGMIRILLRRLA